MNYTFGYNASGTIVAATEGEGSFPGSNLETLTLDDTTTPTGVEVFAAMGQYKVESGKVVPAAYLTASYASGTITVTLNNPPSTPPTSITATVGTSTATLALASNQASMSVALHNSVPVASVQFSASGVVGASAAVGIGRQPPVGLQLIPPAVSGDPYTIAPVGPGSKAYLRAAYLGLTSETQIEILTEALQNLYVTAGATNHLLVTKILPALQAASYTPITLTTAEEASLNNWTANVIPSLLAVSDLLDASGSPIPAYAELQGQAPQAYQGLQAYQQAVQSLPGLE